jgi:type IV pilus assembly protein PilW
MTHSHRYAKGFTLIELMISLVLGLLISAAVMQVYLTNAKTSATQKSGSELQDASLFGIQQLESHLRLANLGNPVDEITNDTPKGGIVLSLTNMGLPEENTEYPKFLTHTAGDSDFTSTSSIASVNSDQLTIQYTNITGNDLSDCESTDVHNGETVIERYFIRESLPDNKNGLVLACDAGRLNNSGVITSYAASDPKTFGNNGQEFIMGIDQFKVLLGTQTHVAGSAGVMRYLTSADYLNNTTTPAPKPAITAVKIGLIVRGSTPVVGSSTKTTFSLLGQNHTLKSGEPNQVRTTYESTTLLRNARVVNVNTAIK